MFTKFSLLACGGILAVTTAGLNQQASAAAVEYNAQGNYILTATLARAPVGDTVELGTFASGFNFAGSKTNYTATNAAFTLYDTTTIGATGSGTSTGQFAALTGSLSASTAGQQLYIWVFNSGTPATATAWAIVTDTTDPKWVVPPAGTTTNQIDTSDAHVFIPAGAQGSIVTDTSAPSGENFSIEMVVPEPSTYVWSFFACGIALVGCQFSKRCQITE